MVMPRKNGDGEVVFTAKQVKQWLTIISALLLVAGVGGYFAKETYAQEMISYRLDHLEEDYVPKGEVELELKNIDERLKRIEGKLEKLEDIDTKLDNLIDEEDMKMLVEAYIKSQE